MSSKFNVQDTLAERTAVYGDYGDGITCQAAMMTAIRNMYAVTNKEQMPVEHEVELNYILIKLVRLAADPSHVDSWRDLSGYSTLAVERLTLEQHLATNREQEIPRSET